MKIKPILLTLIAAAALTTSGCVAGPYEYAYNNSGYYQRDTFHTPVTYVDQWGRVSRGSPPPEAYQSVTYPGPCPPHLYRDKSILVNDRGDQYTITYRK